MLGYHERESGALALLAAQSGGWSAHDESLLDLGSMTSALSTVAHLADLGVVAHLGHPAQPSHDLERALLAGSATLIVTDAVAIAAPWVWVGRSADSTGHTVVDEAGMRDRRHALRAMGASLRLVPSRTTIDERIALAGPHGSLVIEQSRIPNGWIELAGSTALGQGAPVWYGLVESRASLPPREVMEQVWLAFGPGVDHAGSLQTTLGLFADVGVDLQHLRSHRSTRGTHFFFAAFTCTAAALTHLTTTFVRREIAHRVLAVTPALSTDQGPESLTPQWGHQRAALG